VDWHGNLRKAEGRSLGTMSMERLKYILLAKRRAQLWHSVGQLRVREVVRDFDAAHRFDNASSCSNFSSDDTFCTPNPSYIRSEDAEQTPSTFERNALIWDVWISEKNVRCLLTLWTHASFATEPRRGHIVMLNAKKCNYKVADDCSELQSNT
jgi:hypothetical protein